jgi:hypothetical protein
MSGTDRYRLIVDFPGDDLRQQPMRLFARSDIAALLPSPATECRHTAAFAPVAEIRFGGEPPPYIGYVWHVHAMPLGLFEIRIGWGVMLSTAHEFNPPMLMSPMRNSDTLRFATLDEVSTAWTTITERRALKDATHILLSGG